MPQNVVNAQTSVFGSTVTLNFGQLDPNCRYVVVVTPDLTGVDGSCAEFGAYYFTSTYTPLYCSYQSVLSEIMAFSNLFTPHLVYEAIRNASTQADMLIQQGGMGPGVSPAPYNMRPTPYPTEIVQYVKFCSAYLLTLQISIWKSMLSGETKELNDFTVTYGPNTLDRMLKYLQEEMERWRIAMNGWARTRWVVRHGMMVPTGLPVPGWCRKPLGRGEATGLEGSAAGRFGGSTW